MRARESLEPGPILIGFDHSAGLPIVGQSGHSGLWGTLLGSVAGRVSRQAPNYVLVLRGERD